MDTDNAPTEVARNILKIEMLTRRMSYKTLSEKLALIGVHENPLQIKAKINRGAYPFYFFLQVMKAIGVSQIDLSRYDISVENRIERDV
jgi:hypothetical protein